LRSINLKKTVILKEFKEFAMKENLVDIAMGFLMGAAFKQVGNFFYRWHYFQL